MAETDVNVQLTGLKKDIENVTNLNARLDTAIEKLTDVSGDLKSMLAVHEEKISKTESADEQLADLIEVRRQEISNDIKELHTRINSQSKEFVAKLVSRIPMGRMAKKDEYKGSIQFLASEASKYMTGQNIVIDGGRTII